MALGHGDVYRDRQNYDLFRFQLLIRVQIVQGFGPRQIRFVKRGQGGQSLCLPRDQHQVIDGLRLLGQTRCGQPQPSQQYGQRQAAGS